MTSRLILPALVGMSVVLSPTLARAQCPDCPEDMSITGTENLSDQSPTVVQDCPCNEVFLTWGGNATLTVDTTPTFRVAGINADGNTATIDFQANDFKIRLGNSSGNVVIDAGAGSFVIVGTNANASFSSSQETGEIVEVRSPITTAVNANRWIIGNNTLRLAVDSASVRDVNTGAAGAVIDANGTATVKSITPVGNFTVDIASGKTLTVTDALNVGANTMTVKGVTGGSAETLTATAGIALNNASSILSASGELTINTVSMTTSAKIILAGSANLTLTSALNIGANTLTVEGPTSGSATLTSTGGINLNDNTSVLSISGNVTITNVDVTSNFDPSILLADGADLTLTDAVTLTDSTMTITCTTGTSAETITATGGFILNHADARLNITGDTANAMTISRIDVITAGGTVDVDQDAEVTALNMSESATLDVASGKTLTTAATVAASKILTANNTGTISNVVLNGAAAVLNVTANATVTTLNVNVDGGVLDVDSNCTVNECVMKATAGDLEVQNGGFRITTASGFDVNDNTLKTTEAGGTIDLVVFDTEGGKLDVDESTAVTTVTGSADATVDVLAVKVLTTTATVSGGNVLKMDGTGTTTTVVLSGNGAEFNPIAGCTVNVVNINANGAVIDADSSCNLNTVNMTSNAGDLTLEVAGGQAVSGNIDVNNNKLVLADTGGPGTIKMDTDGGFLDVNASTSLNLTISADVTIDVAAGKTLATTASIGNNTLTLAGSGTITRIDATAGKIVNNGGTTIKDLRPTFGGGGTFTYGGSGTSTVVSMANGLPGGRETFRKIDGGTLTLSEGFSAAFASAADVKLDIVGGTVILGSPDSNDDITFDDDGDEITVAASAKLTTFGSFTVAEAGTNVNLDAVVGSVVNLSSTSGAETLAAAADNDFQLLGTVNINGDDGDYTLEGPFEFRFGTVNIGTNGSLINNTPSSEMFFVPDSIVTLEGAASGTLTIDGQSSSTRITVSTTTGSDVFFIDRGVSNNMTIRNVALSNAAYTSDDGGTAEDELTLTNVTDGGNTANWFTPEEIILPDPPPDLSSECQVDADCDDGDSCTDDACTDGSCTQTPIPDCDTGGGPELIEFAGPVAQVVDGEASSAAVSDDGVRGRADVSGADSGNIQATIVDGNPRGNFEGIPDEVALPVTLRVDSTLQGNFTAVVQLCVTNDLLDDAGVQLDDLVLYRFDEPTGPWSAVGQDGQGQGDTQPTDVVGDFGFNTDTDCVWAVTDRLSDFATGLASSTGGGNDNVNGGNGTPSIGDQGACGVPLCGMAGMGQLAMMFLGLAALKLQVRRRRLHL